MDRLLHHARARKHSRARPCEQLHTHAQLLERPYVVEMQQCHIETRACIVETRACKRRNTPCHVGVHRGSTGFIACIGVTRSIARVFRRCTAVHRRERTAAQGDLYRDRAREGMSSSPSWTASSRSHLQMDSLRDDLLPPPPGVQARTSAPPGAPQAPLPLQKQPKRPCHAPNRTPVAPTSLRTTSYGPQLTAPGPVPSPANVPSAGRPPTVRHFTPWIAPGGTPPPCFIEMYATITQLTARGDIDGDFLAMVPPESSCSPPHEQPTAYIDQVQGG